MGVLRHTGTHHWGTICREKRMIPRHPCWVQHLTTDLVDIIAKSVRIRNGRADFVGDLLLLSHFVHQVVHGVHISSVVVQYIETRT